MPVRRFVACIISIVIIVVAQARSGLASDDIRLNLELNRLQQRDTACRISFLINNRLGKAIDELVFEIVLFGQDGKIVRLVAIRPGRLPVEKQRLKQFDLGGTKCADISRVLLNDVATCKGDGLTSELCLDRAKPSSRSSVNFVY